MKRIVKSVEPHDFVQWKKQDKMAHRPNWNRVPNAIRQSVRESLMREQGFICCYCESSVSTTDSHVEHFRPKECFADIQLDYINLHCSCQQDPAPGEPRHCGHRKGSWFDEELLVSPLDSNCEERFRFTANGDIFPRPNDPSAQTTIDRLGLGLPKLNALRAAAVDALSDLCIAEVKQLLTQGTDGRFLEFCTTIKQVLAT